MSVRVSKLDRKAASMPTMRSRSLELPILRVRSSTLRSEKNASPELVAILFWYQQDGAKICRGKVRVAYHGARVPAGSHRISVNQYSRGKQWQTLRTENSS